MAVGTSKVDKVSTNTIFCFIITKYHAPLLIPINQYLLPRL
jgi:hypothetical protein